MYMTERHDPATKAHQLGEVRRISPCSRIWRRCHSSSHGMSSAGSANVVGNIQCLVCRRDVCLRQWELSLPIFFQVILRGISFCTRWEKETSLCDFCQCYQAHSTGFFSEGFVKHGYSRRLSNRINTENICLSPLWVHGSRFQHVYRLPSMLPKWA